VRAAVEEGEAADGRTRGSAERRNDSGARKKPTASDFAVKNIISAARQLSRGASSTPKYTNAEDSSSDDEQRQDSDLRKLRKPRKRVEKWATAPSKLSDSLRDAGSRSDLDELSERSADEDDAAFQGAQLTDSADEADWNLGEDESFGADLVEHQEGDADNDSMHESDSEMDEDDDDATYVTEFDEESSSAGQLARTDNGLKNEGINSAQQVRRGHEKSSERGDHDGNFEFDQYSPRRETREDRVSVADPMGRGGGGRPATFTQCPQCGAVFVFDEADLQDESLYAHDADETQASESGPDETVESETSDWSRVVRCSTCIHEWFLRRSELLRGEEAAMEALEKVSSVHAVAPRCTLDPIDLPQPDPMTVFVRNMSFRVTEYDLHEAFGAYGRVVRVEIPFDRFGRSRGFAFVEMAREESAKRAIELLDGVILCGRRIELSVAIPRNTTSPVQAVAGNDNQQGSRRPTRDASDSSEVDERSPA